jgi:hypothetical protein
MGGQGSFTSAEEYLKILHGLLTTEDNEKILKKETLEIFFEPQLGDGSRAALNAVLQDDMVSQILQSKDESRFLLLIVLLTLDSPGLKANNAMGGTSKQVKKDWGLGGVLIMDDAPDGKKAGTMIWGGLPNLIWVSLDFEFPRLVYVHKAMINC